VSWEAQPENRVECWSGGLLRRVPWSRPAVGLLRRRPDPPRWHGGTNQALPRCICALPQVDAGATIRPPVGARVGVLRRARMPT
jgi:hypothetical protein